DISQEIEVPSGMFPFSKICSNSSSNRICIGDLESKYIYSSIPQFTEVCKKNVDSPPPKVNFGDMFKYWGYRLDRLSKTSILFQN
ncbi:MAG TPA: hypothetical protein O0X39_04685, partial [Methanocorpusculum sp.]|nr:hypothetical protein [Methanocorpusculum sp.]